MVCGAGVSTAGAPLTGPERTDSAAIATTTAPRVAAPSVRSVWVDVMGSAFVS
jgi:hypothetical protein